MLIGAVFIYTGLKGRVEGRGVAREAVRCVHSKHFFLSLFTCLLLLFFILFLLIFIFYYLFLFLSRILPKIKGDIDYVICILYLYTARENKKIIQKIKNKNKNLGRVRHVQGMYFILIGLTI